MPRAALLSIHARVEGTRAVHLGGPIARAALGPALQRRTSSPRATCRSSRSGGCRKTARRGGGRTTWPLDSTRPSTGDAMRYDEAGARARRPRQRAALRRADRHRRDPVGGRAAAHRVDGAAARDGARDGHASSSPVATCTSSVPPRRRRSPSGRGSPRASRRRVRCARRVADPGAHPDRRRVDPRPRRAGVPRRRRTRARPPGSSRAATPTSCCTGPIASSWSPTPLVAASSGPRACGRAPSSSRARSSGRGGARRGR